MRIMKKAAVVLLASVMAAMLLPGCGGGDGGKVTVTIGEIIDLTGPGLPALRNLHLAFEDVIKYFNDEGLIPGVEMKAVTYDDRADPSRSITGYDWCRERGAKAVVTVYTHVTETLKPFAERGIKSPCLPRPPPWACWMTLDGYSLPVFLMALIS